MKFKPGQCIRLLTVLLVTMAVSRAPAQEHLLVRLQAGVSNWGSNLYDMEQFDRGNGFQIRPEIAVSFGNFVLGGRISYSTYNFKKELYNYDFINSEGERLLWHMNDVTFKPVRLNSEVSLGVRISPRVVGFMTAKFIDVNFNQRIPVAEHTYNYATAVWDDVVYKKVMYEAGEAYHWIGFGCRFEAPVYFKRFSVKGDARYYLFGPSDLSVIQAELLFCKPLQKSLSFFIGGSMELVTSSELTGSVWSLCCGVDYSISR